MLRILRLTVFLVLCILATAGCSSDSPPIFLQPCLTFTPDPNPGAVEMRINEEQTGCAFVVIDVFVSNASNVFGAEFTFKYPVPIMEFAEGALLSLDDSFLNEDDLLLGTFANDDVGGVVTAVLTRDGSQTEEGVDAAAGGSLLVSLFFAQQAGTGSGDIEFIEGSLLAPGEPPTPIDDIDFTAGSILIQ